LSACKNTQEEMQENVPVAPFEYHKPTVKIVDGTIIFPNKEEFYKAIGFIEHTSDADLMAWQDEIGFKSSKYYYSSAQETMCCPTSKQDIESLQTQFGENLKYDFENADYSPTYPLSISTWMVNSKGEFYIGEYLTKYTDDRLMNIYQPTEQKIQHALGFKYLTDDVEKIYVHPLFPENTDRTCGSSGIDLCGTGDIFNAGMTKQVSEAATGRVDQSSISAGSYHFWFTNAVHFHAKKKNFWGGWTICDRQNWTYNWSWSHTASFYPNSLLTLVGPNRLNFSISNFTSDPECDYWRHETIISCDALVSNVPNPTLSALYNTRSLTPISQTLSFSASPNGISASGTCP
jgi:hypothetical protein